MTFWQILLNYTTENVYFQKLVLLVFSSSFMSDRLQPHGLQPIRLLCPWNLTGKNTRVGYHFLLYGISPIRGSWSALTFPSPGDPRGSSQPRDQTRVSCASCVGMGIFDYYATWEAPTVSEIQLNFNLFFKKNHFRSKAQE